jgi:hypothetical protein
MFVNRWNDIRLPSCNGMRNFTLILTIFCCFLCGYSGAEIAAKFDSNRLIIVDSLLTSGVIARPQICPADSSWIAYEIYRGDSADLVIHNSITGVHRLIDPTAWFVGPVEYDSTNTRVFRDLSWRPTASGNKLWAAFVSDSNHIQDIYLYEVSSDQSYRIPRMDTAIGGKEYKILGAPSWSPDGECLTFSAGVDGNADINIIYGMSKVLEGPDQEDLTWQHESLIVGEGDQFGVIWCPAPGSGFLAYTDQAKDNGRLRIKVFDLLTSKTFELSGIETTTDYFAPAWNAGGNRIAYYRHRGEDGSLSRFSGPDSGRLELGIATVRLSRDSIILSPIRTGEMQIEKTLDVAPNLDRLLGPAWLPGGRHLVFASFSEPEQYQLHVLSLPEWESGEKESDYWHRGFGCSRFNYPRDVNIVNRNISFTYEKGLRKYLLQGQVAPSIKLVMQPDYLDVRDNRRDWWGDYSRGKEKSVGLLTKIGNFLWSPIIGPDIGINRGVVPVAGGVVLLAVLIGSDSGPDTPVSRDWTPPEFPRAGKINTGINIRIGF